MKPNTNYQNILIIKPSSLGDVVLALPAMASLRASFPKAKISWLIRPVFAPLLRCTPGIDELIFFERKKMHGWWYRPAAWKVLSDFLTSLRNRRFDLVVDFQGLFRTSFFAFYTGCPRRYGMSIAREGAVLFYSHKIRPSSDAIHLIDYYNQIVAETGGKNLYTDCIIEPPDSAVSSIGGKLAAAGLADKNYAVLIPGSAHHSKCWPTQRFAKIAKKLSQELNLSVIGAGVASESILVEQIQQQTPTSILNLAGQTDIPELIALLKGARLVISNDTGPGHLAQAMKTPTVFIFGQTNPLRVGPYKRPENVAAIEPTDRGTAIESRNPAHKITCVSEQLVWEKCLKVMAHLVKSQ